MNVTTRDIVLTKLQKNNDMNNLRLVKTNVVASQYCDSCVSPASHEIGVVSSTVITESHLSGTEEINIQDSNSTISDSEEIDAERKVKGVWKSGLDFFFSCLAFSIGVGNFLRFPPLVFRNGGGVFFIPYLIMVWFCAMPLMYLEMVIGQYSSTSTLQFGNVVPILSGIGVGMYLITFLTCIYYNVSLAWVIFYFFGSMSSSLPYVSCNNTWNTHLCRGRLNVSTFENESLQSNLSQKFRTPSEEYFRFHMLGETEGASDMGGMQWHLSLCLLLAWVLVFLVLLRGVRMSGRIVYVTVLLPWFLMVIFLVVSSTLAGSEDGIRYYFMPKWEYLANASTWADAAGQAFFSLGPCFGGYMSLSSHNKFDYNIQRYAIAIAIMDTFTSALAGTVVCLALGHLSFTTGISIDELTASGNTLAFIVYPELLGSLSAAPMWALIFFLMVFMLGFDSQMTMTEIIIGSLCDIIPQRIKSRVGRRYRIFVTAFVCLFLYFLGLFLVTQGGIYWYQIFDNYAANWNLLVIGICICFSILLCYRWDRLSTDIHFMLGSRPSIFWLLCWILSPISLLCILVYNWITPSQLTYNDYVFPRWTTAIGIGLGCLPLAAIPLGALFSIVKFKFQCKKIFFPTAEWGSSLAEAFFRLDKTMPDYIGGGQENGGFERDDGSTTSPSASDNVDKTDADKASICSGERDISSWFGRYDFYISCLCYSIGLGNTFRFPFLCFKYGGGAFFVPYIFMMVFCGIPLYYFELAIGQYFRQNFALVWKVIPLSRGISFAAAYLLLLLIIYYNVVLSWCLYYLLASLTTRLPWSHCEQDFHSTNCTKNVSLNNDSETNSVVDILVASEEYFKFEVLSFTSQETFIGGIRWHTWLCGMLVWILVCLCVIRGIRSAWKIIYFTLVLPILLTIVLVVYGLLRSESLLGIRHFIKPNWNVLSRPEVWYEALVQVVFSLGIGFGCLINLASYNGNPRQCKNTAITIALIDLGISFLAGLVMFSFAGIALAEELATDDDDTLLLSQIFTSDDVDRVFTSYAALLSRHSPWISASFFATCFFFGFGTLLIATDAFMSAVVTFAAILIFSTTSGSACCQRLFDLNVCGSSRCKPSVLCFGVIVCILNLILTSQGGYFLVKILENYAVSWSVICICFFELVTMSWLVDIRNFSSLVKIMLVNNLSMWWKVSWSLISPLVLLIILIIAWFQSNDEYETTPLWAKIVGRTLQFTPLSFVLIYIFYYTLQCQGSFKQRLKSLFHQNRDLCYQEDDTLMENSLDDKIELNHSGNNRKITEKSKLPPRSLTSKRKVSIYDNQSAIRVQSFGNSKINIKKLSSKAGLSSLMSKSNPVLPMITLATGKRATSDMRIPLKSSQPNKEEFISKHDNVISVRNLHEELYRDEWIRIPVLKRDTKFMEKGVQTEFSLYRRHTM